MSYIVSPAAANDLDEILAFLAEEAGQTIADRFEDHFIATFELLARAPGIGHKRPDLAYRRAVLFFPVLPYLVLYSPHTELVVIQAVLHGARDVRNSLHQRHLNHSP